MVTRPEDVLPDAQDRAEFDGVNVRKGTIAAFIQNAKLWLDPTGDVAQKKELAQELVRMTPALRALGVLDIFEPRDATLRQLIIK